MMHVVLATSGNNQFASTSGGIEIEAFHMGKKILIVIENDSNLEFSYAWKPTRNNK